MLSAQVETKNGSFVFYIPENRSEVELRRYLPYVYRLNSDNDGNYVDNLIDSLVEYFDVSKEIVENMPYDSIVGIVNYIETAAQTIPKEIEGRISIDGYELNDTNRAIEFVEALEANNVLRKAEAKIRDQKAFDIQNCADIYSAYVTICAILLTKKGESEPIRSAANYAEKIEARRNELVNISLHDAMLVDFFLSKKLVSMQETGGAIGYLTRLTLHRRFQIMDRISMQNTIEGLAPKSQEG